MSEPSCRMCIHQEFDGRRRTSLGAGFCHCILSACVEWSDVNAHGVLKSRSKKAGFLILEYPSSLFGRKSVSSVDTTIPEKLQGKYDY